MENALVVKLGGGQGLDLESVADDLVRIAGNRPLVIVHGVSAMMAQLSQERGVAEQMLTSPSGHQSRYTNPEARDLYVEATRMMNDAIVDTLQARGLSAMGLHGAPIIHGDRKRAIRAMVNGRIRMVRDDYSGHIRSVDTSAIQEALAQDHIPVVPPMALSDDGWLNIDGDRAGAAVAGALNASGYLILSNVRGLYRDHTDDSTLIQRIDARQIEEAMNYAGGRMKRKVLGAQEALQMGVQQVIISDGRYDAPITEALNGAGTVFVQ